MATDRPPSAAPDTSPLPPRTTRKRSRGGATDAAGAPPPLLVPPPSPATLLPASARHATMVCFDEPKRPVTVDLSILEPYQPRLLKQLTHDSPELDANNQPFHRCAHRREALLMLLRSLHHGTLSLGKHIGLDEALAVFDFEAIALPPAARTQDILARVRPVELGVGFKKDGIGATGRIDALCEQIADALVRWPRLEFAMDAAMNGHAVGKYAVTPTRAWIAFAPKPIVTLQKGDPIKGLAAERPPWLHNTLRTISSVLRDLMAAKVIKRPAFSKENFALLESAVLAHPRGGFASVELDIPSQVLVDGHKKYDKAIRYAAHVQTYVADPETALSTALAAIPAGARADEEVERHNQRLAFFRACIGLAEQVFSSTPAIRQIFHACCETADGKIACYERSQLAKALKARDVSLLCWRNGCEELYGNSPICFPDCFQPFPPDAGFASTSCFLLDFSKLER